MNIQCGYVDNSHHPFKFYIFYKVKCLVFQVITNNYTLSMQKIKNKLIKKLN